MLQLIVQSLENDSTDAWLKPSFWRLNQNQSLYAEQDSKAGSGPSRNVSVCQGRHAFENLIIEHEWKYRSYPSY